MPKDTLSQPRREVAAQQAELLRILKPAFEDEPVLPRVVTVSRHRGGNASCGCPREGKLHEAVRILIKFKDGCATRCLSEEELRSLKPRTEAYRRLRKARSDLGKWSKNVIELLDGIERERRSVETTRPSGTVLVESNVVRPTL